LRPVVQGQASDPGISVARMCAIAAAALAAGAAVIALVLATDHKDATTVWAIFGPAVGWSFVGTGLYAARRRPESRTGRLMIALGLACSSRRWSSRTRSCSTRSG
jgi:peptidoglycan/LPS O-acetylase OafA/YrhL